MTESKHEMETLLDQYTLRAMPQALHEKLAGIVATEAKSEKRFPAVFILVAMAACALAGVLYFVLQPDDKPSPRRSHNMIADEEIVEYRKPDVSKGKNSHYFRGNLANNAFFEGGLGERNKAQKTLYFTGMFLYQSQRTLVVGVDVANGKIEWSTEFPFQGPTPLVVADGNLYVGFERGYFAALDALTGEELWKLENNNKGFREAPIVHEGTVFVGGMDDCLYAVSTKDGKIVWSIDDKRYGSGNWGSGCFNKGDLYTRGRVGSGFGAITVDIRSGDIKNEFRIASSHAPSVEPIIKGEDLFLFAWSDFASVNMQTKKTKYSLVVPEGSYSHPAMQDDWMVVGSRDMNLYAYSLETGKLEWSTPTTCDLDYAPVIAGDSVFICRRIMNGLSAFDLKTGKLLWGEDQLSTVEAPVVLNGKVYAINQAELRVYDTKTGTVLKNVEFGKGAEMRGGGYPCIAN